MKDPLRFERTPYEILLVAKGASQDEIMRAYKSRFGTERAEALQEARTELLDSERAGRWAFLEYDWEFLAQHGVGEKELGPGARGRSRDTLEAALRHWLAAPRRSAEQGYQLGHCLFLLSYFAARAVRPEAAHSGVLRQHWQRTIGYFGFLAANAPERFTSYSAERLKNQLEDELIAHEREGAGFKDLRLQVATELRAGRALLSERLAGGVGLGPLLAEMLGVRETIATEIQSRAQQTAPSAELRFLATVFKGYGAISALRELRDHAGALAALSALSPDERGTPELRQLRAELLFELGQTLTQPGTPDGEARVMEAWEGALESARDPALKASIEARIEEYALRRASELEHHDGGAALALLERAHRAHPSEKLRAGQLTTLQYLVHVARHAGDQARVNELAAKAQGLRAAPSMPAPGCTPPTPRPSTPKPSAASPPRAMTPADVIARAGAFRMAGSPDAALSLLEQLEPHVAGAERSNFNRERAECLCARAEAALSAGVERLSGEGAPTTAQVESFFQVALAARADAERALALDPNNVRASQLLRELEPEAPAEVAKRARAVAPRQAARKPEPPQTASLPERRVVVAQRRSMPHVAMLVVATALAGAGAWWLASSQAPWVEAVRQSHVQAGWVKGAVHAAGARVLWALAALLFLAPLGLGWLSKGARQTLRLLGGLFSTPWARKGPLGRLLEYALFGWMGMVAYLSGGGGLGFLNASSSPRAVAAEVAQREKAAEPKRLAARAPLAGDRERAARELEARRGSLSVRALGTIRDSSILSAEHSYWFVFAVLILAFKLVQLPAAAGAARATLRLQQLAPEIAALERKFHDDPQARGLALMELYRKYDVHMTGGCVSALMELLLFVWVVFGMRSFAPQWVLDGASFLWLTDIGVWDARVVMLWFAVQAICMLAAGKSVAGDARMRWSSSAMTLIFVLAAWYFKLPAFTFIFMTLLAVVSLIQRAVLTKLYTRGLHALPRLSAH